MYFDNMEEPLMEARDKTFGSGFVGFGSFDDSGKIDNIRIWSPGQESSATGFFSRK